MSRNKWIGTFLLLPLSKIYGMVMFVRNWLFNSGIIKSKKFDVPVIVVGNLAVGGTGKTPHVEYLIERLRYTYRIGVVSRGYKRLTKGFVMATPRSTPADIGDEPYQIYHKYHYQVPVAVCEKRVHGIEELLKIDPEINLIILDDAFQHRYLTPTVSILLTEFNRPVFEDKLLPYGRLRESIKGVKRADMVIATKCPERSTALDFRIFEENLKLIAWQKLYFSRFSYGMLRPVFPDACNTLPPALDWLTENDRLLIVAGIGNPRPFVKYLKYFKARVRVNLFPDHHNFTRKDMSVIKQRFETMDGVHNYLITTEKDAVRLTNCPYFPHQLKRYTFYLPVQVGIMRDQEDSFIDDINKIIRTKMANRGS